MFHKWTTPEWCTLLFSEDLVILAVFLHLISVTLQCRKVAQGNIFQLSMTGRAHLCHVFFLQNGIQQQNSNKKQHQSNIRPMWCSLRPPAQHYCVSCITRDIHLLVVVEPPFMGKPQHPEVTTVQSCTPRHWQLSTIVEKIIPLCIKKSCCDSQCATNKHTHKLQPLST